MKPASIISCALLGALVPVIFLAGATGMLPGATGTPENSSTEEQSMSEGRSISSSGHDVTRLTKAQVDELASKLDPEAFRITQKSGTERPFCGTLLDNKKDGAYACVVCELPLFASDHKFTSGTGWPSFYREYDPEHVARIEDTSAGMARTEIECARCGAHLGHVFPDGPPPTGERHCLNSASLVFVEKGTEAPESPQPSRLETAYFAGGCFWGIEHYFQQGPGVIDAVSGYMQGNTENPTYKDVCSGSSGHTEAVKVVYDPSIISYDHLMFAFYRMHDPTQLNRQGPDRGSQYRSGIYTTSDAQLAAAKKLFEQIETEGVFRNPVVTEIEPAGTFYPAEDYHQDYIETTGRACHVRDPWPGLREEILKASEPTAQVESETSREP